VTGWTVTGRFGCAYDPIVLLHAQALLTSSAEGVTAYLDADLRDQEKILSEAAKTLDFGQPMAVLLLGVLHNVGDADDPYGIVRRLIQAVPGGSYLAICHLTADIYPELAEWARALNERQLDAPLVLRDRAQVTSFFDGRVGGTWRGPALQVAAAIRVRAQTCEPSGVAAMDMAKRTAPMGRPTYSPAVRS
jgi:hypothetical protein